MGQKNSRRNRLQDVDDKDQKDKVVSQYYKRSSSRDKFEVTSSDSFASTTRETPSESKSTETINPIPSGDKGVVTFTIGSLEEKAYLKEVLERLKKIDNDDYNESYNSVPPEVLVLNECHSNLEQIPSTPKRRVSFKIPEEHGDGNMTDCERSDDAICSGDNDSNSNSESSNSSDSAESDSSSGIEKSSGSDSSESESGETETDSSESDSSEETDSNEDEDTSTKSESESETDETESSEETECSEGTKDESKDTNSDSKRETVTVETESSETGSDSDAETPEQNELGEESSTNKNECQDLQPPPLGPLWECFNPSSNPCGPPTMTMTKDANGNWIKTFRFPPPSAGSMRE